MNSNSARQLCTSLVLVLAVLASVGHCSLSDAQKEQALKSINLLRREAYPTAADINAVTWDKNLEKLAQQAANACKYRHNYGGQYARLGEVIYLGGSSDPGYIFNFMYLERECYNLSTGVCNCANSKYPIFNTCGHYLQLVTAKVRKMGCGIKRCNGNNLFFCEFNKGVSYPPYVAGLPGTKCGHGMATYHNQGLCEYYVPYSKTPKPSTVDCRLICLNGGTLNRDPINGFCSCRCPSRLYRGFRCENIRSNAPPITNVCVAQAVTCQNGGTPTQVGAACKCVCPANFQGDSCEVNIEQKACSLFICFGRKRIYKSYWPMPKTEYSDNLSADIKNILVEEVNNYCRDNYATCCPNSNQIEDPFVSVSDCHDLANYPKQQIGGTLNIALFIKLSPTLALQCRGNGNAYLPNAVLVEAYKQAETNIKQIASQANITYVNVC